MTDTTTCYRHDDRRGGVSCQRCGRPICPQCMRQASVGFHCPECARSGGQQIYTARTLRSQTQPVVTTVLIAVNVLALLASVTQGGDLLQGGGDLQVDGGLIGGGIFRDTGPIGVYFGEWWRIVTSGFLHAGLMHLGFNMILLWMLGGQLEPSLGSLRFAVLYAVSLLAGSFGVLLVAPDQLTVGASGAVFGLMGALMVAQWSRGLNPFQAGIGPLVVMNLLITFAVPRISVGGHVGGLLGGMVVGWLLFDLPRRVKLPSAVPVLLAAGLGPLLWIGCLQAASGWI